jgi:hypothetical protein
VSVRDLNDAANKLYRMSEGTLKKDKKASEII